MAWDDEDELGEQRARIPKPVPDATPPVALRGVTPSSTDEMEANAAKSRTMIPTTMTPPAPSALTQRRAGDEAEVKRLQDTGSGISQIGNPWARGALRGISTIGSILSPRAMSAIPGTEEHHGQLLGQARSRVAGDIGEQEKEAQTAKAGAETGEAEARGNLAQAQADVAKNPKTGLTPEETTIHDLMMGDNGQPRINPETKQPYTYLEAYQAVNQTKQDTKPDPAVKEREKDISDYLAAHNLQDTAANREQARQGIANRSKDVVAKNSARSDKSYTYNNDKLDKLAQPIEQATQRMSRLRDTLAQGTPQADALVAPELLTIMAGGMGSGLRMNEAEISRIVGGRSVWENLRANMQHWSTDPESARSITPDQQKQIRALVETVNTKLQAKQKALDDAREALLNSDDPKEHRKIVTNAHHALTQADEGQEQGGGGVETRSYQGHTYAKQPDGSWKLQQ